MRNIIRHITYRINIIRYLCIQYHLLLWKYIPRLRQRLRFSVIKMFSWLPSYRGLFRYPLPGHFEYFYVTVRIFWLNHIMPVSNAFHSFNTTIYSIAKIVTRALYPSFWLYLIAQSHLHDTCKVWLKIHVANLILKI